MINPLSVASDGYLSVAQRVLIIAVAGYLNFGGEASRNDGGFIGTSEEFRGGGGGGSLASEIDQEDEDILIVINAFLSCH